MNFRQAFSGFGLTLFCFFAGFPFALADPPTAGLVGHWGQPKGKSQISDLTNNKNNMRLQGGARVKGGGLFLDASKARQYGTIPIRPAYDFSKGYTLSIWAKHRSWYNNGKAADNQVILVARGPGRNYLFRLQVTGDYNYKTSPHELTVVMGADKLFFRSGVTPSLNVWHHYVATYDLKRVKIFMDGKKILDKPCSYVPPRLVRPLIVGRHDHVQNAYRYYTDGHLRDLSIYKRGLSEAEVAQLGSKTSVVAQGKPQEKELTAIAAFLTDSKKAKGAKPRGNVLKPGESAFLYFKIGNILFKRKKGAPFRARLQIAANNKVVKDFGWLDDPGLAPNPRAKDQVVGWYEYSGLRLGLGANFRPGRYTALLTYEDKNTGRQLEFKYPFELRGKGSAASVAPASAQATATVAATPKGGHWKRVATRKVEHLPPKGKYSFAGSQPGAIRVRYKDSARAVDFSAQWTWSPPPSILRPDLLLKINASGSRLKMKGGGAFDGWFAADWTQNATAKPFTGGNFTLGLNQTAAKGSGNPYLWIHHPKGQVKIPEGTKGQRVAIRVGWGSGGGVNHFYYYEYVWVD